MNNNGYDQPDNTLVLFVNEYKQTENQPDYKGQATVDGQKYKCAGWKKVGKVNGKAYLSVKLTAEVEEQAWSAPAAPKPTPKPRQAEDDDIPF